MMKYAVFALLIALGIASGAVYFQQSRIEVLNQNVATARADVATARAVVERQQQDMKRLSDRRDKDQIALTALQVRLSGIRTERDAARARLDSWRGKLDVETIKRPAVVARAARIALNRSMRRAYKATGGGESAGDIPPPPG